MKGLRSILPPRELDLRKHLYVSIFNLIIQNTLIGRTSNTRSPPSLCIKVMIERGTNICEGFKWIILDLTSLQGK
jgi:hypothetical protein